MAEMMPLGDISRLPNQAPSSPSFTSLSALAAMETGQRQDSKNCQFIVVALIFQTLISVKLFSIMY